LPDGGKMDKFGERSIPVEGREDVSRSSNVWEDRRSGSIVQLCEKDL
jgi:hypothetical protein